MPRGEEGDRAVVVAHGAKMGRSSLIVLARTFKSEALQGTQYNVPGNQSAPQNEIFVNEVNHRSFFHKSLIGVFPVG